MVIVPAVMAQDSWTGGSDTLGVNQASQVWYFAEGYTGPGFEEWLCIQNPHGDLVLGTVTYMLGDGSLREQALSLPANSRTTIMVNSFIGVDQNVSAKVEAEKPVIAERPMYFNYRGKWTGGHDVMGATAPSTDWYFAEGTTREGFEEWLCLMNPGASTAEVTVNYIFATGGSKTQNISVPAHTRQTIDVNGAVGAGQDVSIHLDAKQPIVAERPMYFDYHGWTGGSDTIGATKPDKTWYFAEGTTQPDFDQYVTVQNPGDSPANLIFHYMVEGQGEQGITGSVNAYSRATFNTRSQIGDNKNVSLMLESDQDVVVERPMYFNYHGVWTGGHDVMGANAPNTDWYFAEGTTRVSGNAFDEWLCIQNPGSSDITVNAIYMLGPGQGDPVTKSYTVPAQQRLTVGVNGEIGAEKDVSVHLSSTFTFVAERPMYFNYHPIGSGSIYWPGRDKTPPVTDEVLEPPVAGWTNQSVQVTLEPHDYESGVRRTYYSVDGGNTFNIYGGPFDRSVSGIYPLKYYSTDNVGNIESVKTGSVIRIDKIRPTVSNLTIDGITANTISLKWSGSDNNGGSGVQKYLVLVNGGLVGETTSPSYMVTGLVPHSYTLVVPPETNYYQLSIEILDNAGNTSQTTISTNTVDLPAPLNLMFPLVQPYSIQATWEKPSDEVAAYHIWLGSGGNWTDWGVTTLPATNITGLTPNTFYTIRVFSLDANGNESLVYTERSDWTPPDI